MTLHERARRFVGIREMPGAADHPLILWWMSLCKGGFAHDSVPWCSAFVNGMAWDLELPRSESLAARSWLPVGTDIPLDRAVAAFDVVVFSRGEGPQPGPDVRDAPGHVGVFHQRDGDRVWSLGGNQGNAVSIAPFPVSRVLRVRRLSIRQERI